MNRWVADHVYDILGERGELHASVIKDILYDRLAGGTPSIRELATFLKTDRKIVGRLAPAGERQIKMWALKTPEKKIVKVLRYAKR